MAIRALEANKLIQDQVDLFLGDFYTRIEGLTVSDLLLELFFDNTLVAWPLVTGVGVTDGQVVSGKVYFHEISTNPGFYAIRWRPNIPGYWRLILSYDPSALTIALDYDIGPVGGVGSCGSGGLRASFVK